MDDSADMMSPTLEVFHESEEPFIVDHTKLERAFGADVPPHREAIAVTLEWYGQNPNQGVR